MRIRMITWGWMLVSSDVGVTYLFIRDKTDLCPIRDYLKRTGTRNNRKQHGFYLPQFLML